MLLHHKFCSGSFQPSTKVQAETIRTEAPKAIENAVPKDALSHDELLKLSPSEKGKLLREQRSKKVVESKNDTERVPTKWPLPKEKRLGEENPDNRELSPEEFSNLLVGGRSG